MNQGMLPILMSVNPASVEDCSGNRNNIQEPTKSKVNNMGQASDLEEGQAPGSMGKQPPSKTNFHATPEHKQVCQGWLIWIDTWMSVHGFWLQVAVSAQGLCMHSLMQNAAVT